MDQEGKNGQQQQSGVPWAAVIFFVALVFLLIVLGGYLQGWEWTGFIAPRQRKFWDWLNLLIVPAVLALGGYFFSRSENRRSQAIANQQIALDREIAQQRTQEEALQAYLDQMGQLLLGTDRPLRQYGPGDDAQLLARAWTLTVLHRLDGVHKARVLQFLHESKLIKKGEPAVFVINANLSNANLTRLDLEGADLRGAYLNGAHLNFTVLHNATIGFGDLSDALLYNADLSDADLSHTNLSGAFLYEADLSGADLSNADLSGLKAWTLLQLITAKTLEGATMPDGQILKDRLHPDGPTFEEWTEEWIKSKTREEDVENE